jgi:aquaporin Z
MFGKRKVAAIVAEFLGTGILTLLVLSVQRSTIGVPFFVASAAGLTVAAMYLVFSGVSGAFFNPAIAIAMWTARKLSTVAMIIFVAVELAGAYGAYRLYEYLVKNKLSAVGGHYSGRTLVAEAIAALILGVVWATVSYRRWTANQGAAAVGIAVMVSMIAASVSGIGLVNPALALGINAWVWGTYVLGPVIGAVVGVNLFGQLFATREEVVAAASVENTLFAVSPTPLKTKVVSTSAKPLVKKKTTASRSKTKKSSKR